MSTTVQRPGDVGAGPPAGHATGTRPIARPERRAGGGLARRLNVLRAGVLGANDGIVSTAAVVVGVAAATTQVAPILTAGAVAVAGGAISMALGEYVSVSSQRDTERALIDGTSRRLEEDPGRELETLTRRYQRRGLSRPTAERVAQELSADDALDAHLSTEHHIDRSDVASPWQAAAFSFAAFLLGALLPMLSILLPPPGLRVPLTVAAVLVALALTGSIAAWIGGAPRVRAAARVVFGGALALMVTYGLGALIGGAWG